MKDKKFIIIKTKIGKLNHFTSDTMHHSQLARAKGYKPEDIVESGVIIENKKFIFECENKEHILKHKNEYIGNVLNNQELNDKIARGMYNLAVNYLKTRELESQLYYSKQAVGLPDGD